MDIRFGDHASFHRAAAGMVGGSLLAGLLAHPLVPHSSVPIAPLVGGIAGVAAGMAIGYGRPVWRFVAAVLACVPLFLLVPATWTSLTITAATMALAIALGGRDGATRTSRPQAGWTANARAFGGLRGAINVGIAAGTLLLGMWCALKFATASEIDGLPPMWHTAVSSAALGIVGMLAVLPRHLKIALDPVTAAVRRLPPGVDGEVKTLCDRALAIWTNAKDKLADDGGRALLRDGVVKTLEVAIKSADVRPVGATDAELAARMADLDARIAAASDDETRTQYKSARAALDDQRRYREHIAKGRERLVARMHNHVAALEKFQLAATGLEAARAATAGAPAVKQLDELSQDVTASGEALAEIEIGDATATEPAPATASN